MAFTLKIEFRGMIAFVPVNGGSSLMTLMVDARSGRQASDGHHIPPHVPVVKFDRRNVADPATLRRHEEGRQKVFYLGQQEMESEVDLTGLWFLDNQDLDLRYDGQDVNRVNRKVVLWDEEAQRRSLIPANGRGPATFFSRLPHLENVVSSASRVDPDCLVPKPKEGLLAGRFLINEGIVESLTPPTDQAGNPIPAQFRPLGSSLPATVLTQSSVGVGLSVEIQVPGKSATLVSTLFGDATSKAVLKLAPAKDQKTPVHLKVWNLPLADVFGLPSFDHSAIDLDRHFEMFYELSLRRPALHNRPVPHFGATQNNGGGHSHFSPGPIQLTTPFCPPAVFQG